MQLLQAGRKRDGLLGEQRRIHDGQGAADSRIQTAWMGQEFLRLGPVQLAQNLAPTHPTTTDGLKAWSILKEPASCPFIDKPGVDFIPILDRPAGQFWGPSPLPLQIAPGMLLPAFVGP